MANDTSPLTTLSLRLSNLLAELGFVYVPALSSLPRQRYHYWAESEDYRVLIQPLRTSLSHWQLDHVTERNQLVDNDFSIIEVGALVEQTKSQLECWGYPVTVILRRTRLRALLS